MSGRNDDLLKLIRTIPDFPKPGILFRDITTLIHNAEGLRKSIERLAQVAAPYRPTLVAGMEARGFIFGAGVAHQLGLGFVPVRKSRKLPGAVIGIDYELEYGLDRLEIHDDVLVQGDRVLIIDDLIATGGTATATVDLIRLAGAQVAAACFVVDLPALGGAGRLRSKDVAVETLLSFEGH